MAGENINYQGNAGLAQGSTVGEGAGSYVVADSHSVIDTLDKLMMYQFTENKDRWAKDNLQMAQDAITAGKMAEFTLSEWTLPQNREAVMTAIDEYNAYYGRNPSAVRLRTDPKTGKILNEEAYLELQRRRNNVLALINQANAKEKQITTVRADTKTQTSPTKYAEAKAHELKMEKTGVWENITTFPNIVPFDIKKEVVGPTVAPKIQVPGTNDYLTLDEYSFTDLNAGRAAAIMRMDSEPDYLADMQQKLARWLPMIQQAKKEHSTWDDAQVVAYMATTANGQGFADLYNNYMYRRQNVATVKGKYPQLIMPDTPVNIELDKLNEADMAAMIQAAQGTWNMSESLDLDQAKLQRAQMQNAANISAAGNRTQIKVAEINREGRGDGTGKPPAPVVPEGAGPVEAFVTLANYAEATGATAQTLADLKNSFTAAAPNVTDQDMQAAFGKYDPAKYNMYLVQQNPTYQNMFRERTAGPMTVADPLQKTQPAGTTGSIVSAALADPAANTVQELKNLGTVVITPKPGKGTIEDNRYVTMYQNPATGEITYKPLDNTGMRQNSLRIYDNTGTANVNDLQGVGDKMDKYLTQIGSNRAAKTMDITRAYYAQGGAPAPAPVPGQPAPGQPTPAPAPQPVKLPNNMLPGNKGDTSYIYNGTVMPPAKAKESFNRYKKNNPTSPVKTFDGWMNLYGIGMQVKQ